MFIWVEIMLYLLLAIAIGGQGLKFSLVSLLFSLMSLGSPSSIRYGSFSCNYLLLYRSPKMCWQGMGGSSYFQSYDWVSTFQ